MTPDEKSCLVTSHDSNIWCLPVDTTSVSFGSSSDPTPAPLLIIEGKAPVLKFAVLSDGRSLLTMDLNGNIRLWDIVSVLRG